MFETSETDELSRAAARARTLVRMAEAISGDLARLDVDELSGSDLAEVTLALERVRRGVDAAESHTLAGLHERRCTETLAGHATSRWLAHTAGLPTGTARRRLVVANQLAALPAVDEAFSTGRIGFDHAVVFADAVNTRNADAITPLLPDLIDAAAGTVFSRWKADVTALAELLDADGGHDPADDLARNTLRLSPSNGFTLGRFELTGEHALCVTDTLHAIADELFHQHSRDHQHCGDLQIPNRATLLALALEEVCRRALAVDRHTTRPPRVEATLTLHTTSPPPAPGGSEPTDPAGFIWWARDRLGHPHPAATLPTFLCDPAIHTALLDSLGLPVDMGRATRTATPTQRRALTLRDGGCTFPGCDTPAAWTDAHHITHWDAGNGPSNLDNFTLLCRRHHQIAHRTGWNVTLTPDGWTHWTTPTRTTTWGQRHHHQRAGPAP